MTENFAAAMLGAESSLNKALSGYFANETGRTRPSEVLEKARLFFPEIVLKAMQAEYSDYPGKNFLTLQQWDELLAKAEEYEVSFTLHREKFVYLDWMHKVMNTEVCKAVGSHFKNFSGTKLPDQHVWDAYIAGLRKAGHSNQADHADAYYQHFSGKREQQAAA